MPARLFGDQAECIPLGYAQDIAFCLIQAPHFAFHDPCVIFRVQIGLSSSICPHFQPLTELQGARAGGWWKTIADDGNHRD